MSLHELHPDGSHDTHDRVDQAEDRVSFGGRQTLEVSTARAVIELWYAKAPANVGTALTAPEVGALVVELLTPEVMSLILTSWRNRNAALFGSYLAEALTGARPSSSRKRGQQ